MQKCLYRGNTRFPCQYLASCYPFKEVFVKPFQPDSGNYRFLPPCRCAACQTFFTVNVYFPPSRRPPAPTQDHPRMGGEKGRGGPSQVLRRTNTRSFHLNSAIASCSVIPGSSGGRTLHSRTGRCRYCRRIGLKDTGRSHWGTVAGSAGSASDRMRSGSAVPAARGYREWRTASLIKTKNAPVHSIRTYAFPPHNMPHKLSFTGHFSPDSTKKACDDPATGFMQGRRTLYACYNSSGRKFQMLLPVSGPGRYGPAPFPWCPPWQTPAYPSDGYGGR